MTNKHQVLKIYPNAVCSKDIHNYGCQTYQYVIINDIPFEYLSEKIEVDFVHIRNKTKIHPLSTWCNTEEDAWKHALELIQNKVEEKLSL